MTPYFGQDFTSVFLIEKMELTPIYLSDGSYDICGINMADVDLIISRYPDNPADSKFIKQYSSKIPVVLHLHLRYHFLNPDQKRTLSESIPCAAKLITNCKMLQEEYQNIFPLYNWTYINNGINPNIFYSTTFEERTDFKEAHKIPQGKVLLSYTGRLNLSKGVQLLEKIFEFISSSQNHFLLIQTIYMPKYDSIVAEITKQNKNVLILFNQDNKAVRYCDVHISTSLSETTSLVTLESLFSGVPVICTDITEFYREIDTGFTPFDYFQKVHIEESWISYNSGKPNIRLNRADLQRVADDFILKIQRLEPLTQDQRTLLSSSFANSQFNADRMVESLTEAYKTII